MKEWKEVTKRRPCPICEHTHYCARKIGGDAVHCMWASAPPPDWKIVKRSPADGSIVVAPTDSTFELTPQPIKRDAEPRIDAPAIHKQCLRDLGKRAAALARGLGVTARSLHRLGLGWSEKHLAFTFPMSNAGGQVIGLRLRCINGRKLSLRGSRTGLFIPADLSGGGRLLICEGPTDTAAMLDLGFDALGRPSCSGGGDLICRYVALHPRRVVIVADNDKPDKRGRRAGLDGGLALHDRLRRDHRDIILIQPTGAKDAREWVKNGAQRADVDKLISRTWENGSHSRGSTPRAFSATTNALYSVRAVRSAGQRSSRWRGVIKRTAALAYGGAVVCDAIMWLRYRAFPGRCPTSGPGQ